jgi:hypothetical protein
MGRYISDHTERVHLELCPAPKLPDSHLQKKRHLFTYTKRKVPF